MGVVFKNCVVLLQHKMVHKDDTGIGINVKKLYKCHENKGTEYKSFTITKYLKIKTYAYVYFKRLQEYRNKDAPQAPKREFLIA